MRSFWPRPFGRIENLLTQLLAQGRLTMSALDDLKAADAKLGTSVAAAVSTLAADAAALAAAAAAPNDSTDLAALAADLNAKAAALDNAVNPAPAPAPAPVPADPAIPAAPVTGS